MEIFKNVRKQVSSQLDQMKLNREIETLQQLVREDPRNVEALRRLAEAYQAAGNVEAAISHFIKLADLYKTSKQAELALAFYRKVERMVDSDQRATILKQMVNIYFDTRQFDKAYEQCRQIISLYVGANQPEAAQGFMKMLPEFGEKDADYRKELREMIQERDEKWMQGAKATWVDGNSAPAPSEDDFSDQVILLVDDEPHVLMILEKVIKPLGCKTMTANNGMEALERIKQQTPTIIISDLMMPKMDGSQLFATIQQDPKLANIPFVCLTSRDQEEEKVSAFEKGVEDYWSKPFSVKEIPVRVKRLLRRTRGAVPKPVVGNLATSSVIDLLNQFERERKSGTLQIISSTNQKGTLFFRDGTAVDAECEDKRGVNAVFTLVGWKEGAFNFMAGQVPNEDVIGMRAQALILEALRRFDEEQELTASLPNPATIATLPPGFNITWFAGSPPDLVRRLLALFDGRRTIGDCIDQCNGDMEMLRMLASLWSAEVKQAHPEAAPEPSLVPPAPPAMSTPGYGVPSLGAPENMPLTPQAPPGFGLPPAAPPPPGNWGQSGTFPSMEGGYPPQNPFQPQYPGYPPQGYPGYPAAPGYPQGYPNPYGGYPGAQMPPQPPGYPGMGYPGQPYPPQQPGGFQSGNYPMQPPAGYPGGLPGANPSQPKPPAAALPPKPAPPPAAPAAPPAVDVSVTFADPQAEPVMVQKLFDAVVAAKKQCGESLDEFTFQRFQRILAEQAAKIKSQLNCSRVTFSVHVENGRVKFVGKGA
ncbi:MAG: response regulator [Blastocatellia bacterium]|nr:response regulator [Blastocatellia bacterium]